LRDADQALSAGRGSRLSQILQNTPQVRNTGDKYDPNVSYDHERLKRLHILGIGDLANALLEQHEGVIAARGRVNDHLKKLSFHADNLRSNIKVSGAAAKEDVRLRQLLEKLDLNLDGMGRAGLGSNNLLFIACELLLVAGENEGNRMLLIEEPEAHVHAQRQLQVMKFMEQQAREEHIQIIVTTHSPNLASALDLSSIVMIRNGHAFPMAEGQTELEPADYRFLERFLDVTKANLFFARGVVIVEGDAENILIPTLATLIGRDFTKHGISIVNVGGVGLRRYARIFQRKGVKNENASELLDIPVACVTDMDVMPNCAPVIVGKVKEGDGWPDISSRRWRAKKDFLSDRTLKSHRGEKEARASGQNVKTFVSDEWTLEYDLALGRKGDNGMFHGAFAEDVFIAACLANKDDAISAGTKTVKDVEREAASKFTSLREAARARGGSTAEEVLASEVYARFAKDDVSKAIAAQYLANRLQSKHKKGELTSADLRTHLPKYLIEAIDYVTSTTTTKGDVSEGNK
jgi:putative ATP-dependent endonuclease of OLD family